MWFFNRRHTLKRIELSGSEAVYGFASWLTTRDRDVTLGVSHDAAIAADLCKEFCKTNYLADPRDDWADILIHPKST